MSKFSYLLKVFIFSLSNINPTIKPSSYPSAIKKVLFNSVNKKFESTFSKACRKERVPSTIPIFDLFTKGSVFSG